MQVNFAGFKSWSTASTACRCTSNTRPERHELRPHHHDAGCARSTATRPSAYVRSRGTYQVSRRRASGRPTPRRDIGRISRQQDFIRARHPPGHREGRPQPDRRSPNLVDVGVSRRRARREHHAGQDLIDLGNRFRNFDPDDLTDLLRRRLATGGVGRRRSVLVLNEAAPSRSSPSSAASDRRASDVLRRRCGSRCSTAPARATRARPTPPTDSPRGFTVTRAGVDDSTFRNDITTVRYAPGARPGASVVARTSTWTRRSRRIRRSPTSEHQVTLVTGRDFTGVREDWRPRGLRQYLPGAVRRTRRRRPRGRGADHHDAPRRQLPGTTIASGGPTATPTIRRAGAESPDRQPARSRVRLPADRGRRLRHDGAPVAGPGRAPGDYGWAARQPEEHARSTGHR